MASYDTIIFNVCVFITGLFVLDYGADKFVDHTAVIARRLGISATLIGLLTAGAEWEEVCRIGHLVGCKIAVFIDSFTTSSWWLWQR